MGKAQFLDFYAEARKSAFTPENIKAGWRATGLYPINRQKALQSRWVIEPTPVTLPRLRSSHVRTLARSQDVVTLLSTSYKTLRTRLIIRKVAMSFGKKVVELAIKDREIARLEEQIRKLQPRKKEEGKARS